MGRLAIDPAHLRAAAGLIPTAVGADVARRAGTITRVMSATAQQPKPVTRSGGHLLGSYDYPRSHRVLELASVAVFAVFATAFSVRVGFALSHRFGWLTLPAVLASALAAYAASDLLSGLVHFLFDNFGSPTTPVIGQKFVKPFREHHVDPMAMTHGDFVAVNADNFFACLPVLVPGYFLIEVEHHPYASVFLVALMLATIVTNQIHKWAHMPRVPRLVRVAQARGIVLSAEHHKRHHTAPFDDHYCITWGRLDALLDAFARRVVRNRPSSG
jgi:ubiquitin-conjugating enzyme E2 variant